MVDGDGVGEELEDGGCEGTEVGARVGWRMGVGWGWLGVGEVVVDLVKVMEGRGCYTIYCG